VVMGNMDAWLLQPEPKEQPDLRRQRWQEIDLWCADQLSSADRAYLRAFQPSLEYPLLDEKTLVCYHGSPRSYKERILPTTPEEELEQALAGTRGDLLVGGHTHAQMFRRFKDLLVFNPGSVGLAMDRVSPLSEIRQPAFAEYAIVEYDKTTLQVELHRIAFDLQAFIQVMHASGMPHAAWWASHWKEAEKWPFLRAMLGFPRLSKKRARQRATSLGMGCGTHHILSVVEYGKQLAAILDADANRGLPMIGTESRNRNVAQRSHGSLKDTFYSFREKMICSCEATGLLANCIVQLTYHSFPETV
jgi:predicted phosphodiesterase